jgi:hypothetical protein
MKRILLSMVAVVGGLSAPTAQQSASDSIRNCLQVNGDFCTGGQPRFEAFAALKSKGEELAKRYVGAQTGSSPAPSASLDYEFFKTRVQPIFVARRPGHARCVACHASGTPLRLQPLAPGSTTWSEEDSRRNFEAVRRLVVPGSVKSRLLIHPLAEEAGGDFYHNGGKHWSAQDDPEWQTLKAWVLGQTTK